MSKTRVLIIDDTDILLSYCRQFLSEGYEYTHCTSGKEVEKVLNQSPFDLILLDKNFKTLPPEELLGPPADAVNEGLRILKKIRQIKKDLPVIMITSYADYESAAQALRLGAFDYVESDALQKDEMFLRIKMQRALQPKGFAREDLIKKFNNLGLIGKSKPMELLFEQIESASQSDSNVLIQGDTGTGKELVAKAIHKESKRADFPLVVVDCTTLPQNLIESILFGIEKNVATSVDARIGKFELASGGTLFFDEIGDLSLELQPKLLRAIEEKKIERIGSAKPISVDVRIIVTTNRNISEEIKNNRFRADLFYRLNQINIKLPPLSQRRQDIALLVYHFIEQKCQQIEKTKLDITRDALEYLSQRNYPGNVRELENLIYTACEKVETLITLKDLYLIEKISQEPISEISLPEENFIDEKVSLDGKTLSELERLAIIQALKKHNGYVEPAAKSLGIGKTMMYERINRYQLKHLVKGYSIK